MFNPDTAAKSLASCVYPVEELCLDAALAGVMFNGELQIEVEDNDWYIHSVTATNTKGVTQVYRFGHPIFEAVTTVVIADKNLCDLILDECVEHAQW